MRNNSGGAFTLGVLSWNFGKNATSAKAAELAAALPHPPPHVLVVGFQEMKLVPFSSINTEDWASVMQRALKPFGYTLVKYEGMSQNSMSSCSDLMGFGIKTIVFARSGVRALVEKHAGHCNRWGTKGFVVVRLQVNAQVLSIVNMHAPFNTEEKSVLFYSNLERFLAEFDADIPKHIVSRRVLFGDVNSRSLITADRAYVKNVKAQCSGEERADFFCQMKTFLESLPLENTLSYHGHHGRTRRGAALRLLVYRDLVGNPPNHPVLFRGLHEGGIEFLPTYKRNKNTGAFQLCKGKEYRLPGYADRIFFDRASMTCLNYTSLPVIGSDHLPVYGLLSVTGSSTGGTHRSCKRAASACQSCCKIGPVKAVLTKKMK